MAQWKAQGGVPEGTFGGTVQFSGTILEEFSGRFKAGAPKARQHGYAEKAALVPVTQ